MWKYSFEVCEASHVYIHDVFASDLFDAYEQILELSDRIERYQLLDKQKVEDL